MGKTFEQVDTHLPPADNNSIILEIGSDRYEGSTEYFAQLAERRGEEFHTVDLSEDARIRISRYRTQGINYHIAKGSTWCQEVLPTLGKKISVVYLDNFDWLWDADNIYDPSAFNKVVEQQTKIYKDDFGLIMNNNNSQIEHLRQGLALLPFMHEQGIIACDDTYTWNDCWVGKCGPLVVYLEARGWSVIDRTQYGVILQRQHEN